MIDDGKHLRIAYLTPEFVTEDKFDGGLANYLNRLVRYLASEGHHPEIFVLSDRDETLDHHGVTVHRVRTVISGSDRFVLRIINRTTGINLNATVPLISGARSLANRFMRQHRERPYDLVQSSDYGATGLYVPRKRSFPLVTRLSYHRPTCREMAGARATFDRRWAERLEGKSIRRSDGCYGPSRRIAEVVRREMGVPVEIIRPPVTVQDNGLVEDESVFQSRVGDRPFVLYFGRVCRIKGADLLAEAMRPLLKEDSSLHLVIVGREDPPGFVDEIRNALGDFSGRLIAVDRLLHPQLFPIIRQAQAVVLPSRIDNFPNTCIEAMRLGQVVIGTREASFDELIDEGVNGFLASYDSVASITAAIRRVLSLTSEQRQTIGNAARSRISEFSPEATIPPLCDFYQRAIAARRD